MQFIIISNMVKNINHVFLILNGSAGIINARSINQVNSDFIIDRDCVGPCTFKKDISDPLEPIVSVSISAGVQN